MKNLSMAAAGAAFITLGAVGAAPAAAGTIGFNYNATMSGDAFVEPSFASQIENALGLNPGYITPGNSSYNESFAGMFTTLDDPNQYLDGDIEVTLHFLVSALGFDTSNLDLLLAQTNLTWSGTGNITSGLGILPFNFGFNNSNNSIKITFDKSQADIIDGCLVGECTTQSTGSVSLTLLNNTEVLSMTNMNFSVTTNPKSIPESSTLLGLIGVGGFFAAKRKRVKAE
ncbi:MAG: PEP-CTERM sorting domain-containing protein [Xenococcaceae cyanobacterium]